MTEVWLICGGLGFIGSAVAEEARRNGIGVSIYDKKMDGFYGFNLPQMIKNADVVLSFIAIPRIAYCQQYKREAFKANVSKNIEIADLCVEYDKPFIFASSFEVFRGKSYYAMTKRMMEKAIMDIFEDRKYKIIRYSHVFGKHDPHKTRVISQFLKGNFVIYNSPNKKFYFTYLPDVAKMTVNIVNKQRYNYTYNIFTYTAYTLHEVVVDIFKAKRYTVEIRPELKEIETTDVLGSHFKVVEGIKCIDDVRTLDSVIKDGKIIDEKDTD